MLAKKRTKVEKYLFLIFQTFTKKNIFKNTKNISNLTKYLLKNVENPKPKVYPTQRFQIFF